MSTPLSAAGWSSESQAWQELEDVFARLGQLARSSINPSEFYRTVLDESTRAFSAHGGAVWLRTASGELQPAVQIGWPTGEVSRDPALRAAHERLLSEAAVAERVVSIAPNAASSVSGAVNTSDNYLVVAPVILRLSQTRAGETIVGQQTLREEASTLAIIELAMPDGLSPATYRGCEQFLNAICEVAADFHALHELRCLREEDGYRNQLLKLSRAVHRPLNLAEVAYTVANEARRVVGCDRFNVLIARGRGCRLLATSGVSRPEYRSAAARELEQLAEHVRRTDEAAFYDDGQTDALPPVAEVLERHVEQSHARQVAAVPLRPPDDPADAEYLTKQGSTHSRCHRPQFVLVAEQFHGQEGTLSRDRLVEVSEICTTALYNALELDRLPLAWLLRPLGLAKQQLTEHLPRTAAAAVAILATIAALVIIPADFTVEATGSLQPIVRRDVFAPRNGLIDEVLVAHGTNVSAGEALVRMRDPTLELELKRVDGELATAQRQLDAVRTTRTNRAIRDANPVDAYRLSADERDIQQRLNNLRNEFELLTREREQLVVVSPIAGRVLTWDVGNRLAARPVERGEVLVTVADLSAEWQLELDVPDDRIGYVLAAQQEIGAALTVRYRLSSDDRERHIGHIVEICRMASVGREPDTKSSPSVLVRVAVDSSELKEVGDDLRPGISARAQIECGRRPLGYVWLHDMWDTAIAWLRF